MAFSPIAFIAPNYRDFKNYWLKAYEPGTTTPKAMALDPLGDVQVAKLELNKDGFIESAGGALVIPYIDGFYDAWLFPTEAEADANDTINAERVADDIVGVNGNTLNSFNVKHFDTLTLAVNSTDTLLIAEGAALNIKERTTGNDGGAMWDVVLASSVTPNAIDIIQCVGVPTLALVFRLENESNAKQYGAIGDGATNDTQAFSDLEQVITGRDISGVNASYVVDSIPLLNSYYDGFWIVGADTFPMENTNIIKQKNGRVAIGDNALSSLPADYDTGASGSVIAIGRDAMKSATQVKKAWAMGPGCMSEGTILRDNIGWGEDALKFIQSDSADHGPFPGTRMVSLGSNSFRFATTANRGSAMGRNVAQAVTTSIEVTAIGPNALSSYCPIGFSGEIENLTPVTTDGITAIGASSLALCDGTENAAIGRDSGASIKKATANIFAGAGAGRLLDSDLSNTDNILDLTPLSGTYSVSGVTVTVDVTGVNSVVGLRVRLKPTSGNILLGEAVDVVVLTAPTANQFTFDLPSASSGVGNIDITQVETAATRQASDWNCLVGARAGELSTSMVSTTVNGFSAAKSFNGTSSVFNGWNAGVNLTSGDTLAAYGHQAMRFLQSGSDAVTLSNSACLGANTRVSGDNQVQLGDAATTTYAYGAVQDRSDARDKIIKGGISDGLIAFFMAVEWKRYVLDYRDDYLDEETYKDENGEDAIRLVSAPKDGSRARTREHVGAIAQQVEEAMNLHGVDFAGLQHHSVNGGCDVYTIGYQEFIAIQGEIIQRQQKRLDSIEQRLAAAGI